jgi:hypothetical protein
MNQEEERKKTLDHHIDEKFGEIFFIAKEEYDIKSNTEEEQLLYDLLNNFKLKLKERCENHFSTTTPDPQ